MDVVKGYVDHIIYQNKENGYAVLDVLEEGEEIICVGVFPAIASGEAVCIRGNFVEHPVYGKQLKAESYDLVEPEDAVSMERYLASGAIKGIGPALAARIVKTFGDETFFIMETQPERLEEVKGISEKKAREIGILMEEKKELREAVIFLQKYGISNTLAVKIYNTYEHKVYGVLQENPYRLAEDIQGVGFRIADEIARKIGIRTDSDYRIRSGILYALLQSAADGNTYLPREELLKRSSELLETEQEQLLPQLDNMMMEKKILIKEKNGIFQIYASQYYYAELNCAGMLRNLNIGMEEAQEEKERIRQNILRLEENAGQHLDELQRHAVIESIRNGVFILSGGPGTGKTTTINMMIQYFQEAGMDFYLAAPTGRAAKRMTETTGYEAKTVHRLLELNGAVMEERKGASFEKNEENPLEADAVIIDEMSMVDIHLFQALLKAIMPGTRLIMVGDVNQLPSVGPGQVLRDLIDSGCFSVVTLQKIFRQAEESDIVMNAHAINKGMHIRLDNKSKDFFFLERNDVNVIYKHMIQLVQEKMPPYVKASPYEIQVLTPMRKGNLGVEVLNQILQKYLNPADKKKKELMSGERLFREGDKVMQTKNNYQAEWEVVSRYGIPVDKGMGIFNGDMGIIREINDFAMNVTVEFDEGKRVQYPFSQMDEIELSYAITIHKSQGSEYPAVIMPILSGPRMLFNRNLLYTGVTRAKYCVTILGSREMVNGMIDNENEQKRMSGLNDRIREVVGENPFDEGMDYRAAVSAKMSGM